MKTKLSILTKVVRLMESASRERNYLKFIIGWFYERGSSRKEWQLRYLAKVLKVAMNGFMRLLQQRRTWKDQKQMNEIKNTILIFPILHYRVAMSEWIRKIFCKLHRKKEKLIDKSKCVKRLWNLEQSTCNDGTYEAEKDVLFVADADLFVVHLQQWGWLFPPLLLIETQFHQYLDSGHGQTSITIIFMLLINTRTRSRHELARPRLVVVGVVWDNLSLLKPI